MGIKKVWVKLPLYTCDTCKRQWRMSNCIVQERKGKPTLVWCDDRCRLAYKPKRKTKKI